VPAHLDRGWIRGQDTALLVHHDKRVRESLVDRSSDPALLGGRLVLAFGLLGDDCLLPAPDCCIRVRDQPRGALQPARWTKSD
jgi:hypothetical protein